MLELFTKNESVCNPVVNISYVLLKFKRMEKIGENNKRMMHDWVLKACIHEQKTSTICIFFLHFCVSMIHNSLLYN